MRITKTFVVISVASLIFLIWVTYVSILTGISRSNINNSCITTWQSGIEFVIKADAEDLVLRTAQEIVINMAKNTTAVEAGDPQFGNIQKKANDTVERAYYQNDPLGTRYIINLGIKNPTYTGKLADEIKNMEGIQNLTSSSQRFTICSYD